MKLLFETWRRFLKEDIGYFGESFVEFKRRTESGEHPLKVANEMLDFVGKGSTRMVFGFPDNKTHLLKIINVETIGDEEAYAEDFVNPMTGFTRKHKTVSNENEADLKIQQRYSRVFPRSYEYAEDFSWILTERVQPIDNNKLADVFNIPVEILSKENRKDYLELLDITLANMKERLQINEGSTIALDPDRDRVTDPGMIRRQELQSYAENILSDKHNRQIFLAVAELGIPPRELLPKNLGISKFGQPHLVILDASLWEYDAPPAKAPVSDTEDTFNF